MRFGDYHKNFLDIIAIQIDKSGKNFKFAMSDGNEYNIKRVKEFKGGKSGDNVIMIEIEGNNYVLKIFSDGDRKKMIMNAKEIDIHKNVMDIFKTDYKEQGYMMCPLLFCYGYMKEVEFGQDESETKGGFLRYVIMELVSPSYELYNYVEDKCSSSDVMYDLNLDHILLQIFYFVGKMILAGMSHCDLHLKNIMIVPHKFKVFLGNVTNVDKEVDVSHCIKVIDFGLSEDNDIPCSKIRRTSSSLNDLMSICNGKKETLDLVFGELGLIELSNPDLNFLCNIIYIFSLIDYRFQKINIDYIKKQSDIIVNVKGVKNKKDILTDVLRVLLS